MNYPNTNITGNAGDIVLTTDGNVGIGKTTPGCQIDILGGAGQAQVRIENSAADEAHLELKNPSGSVFAVLAGQNAQGWIGSNAGDFVISNRAGGKITLSSDINAETGPLNILSSGNVGIGTTSPSFPLHIYKASDYAVLKVESASGGGGDLMLVSGQDMWEMYAGGADLVFDKNQSTKMIVKGDGNMGVGTTSPSSLAGGCGLTGINFHVQNSSTTQYQGYARVILSSPEADVGPELMLETTNADTTAGKRVLDFNYGANRATFQFINESNGSVGQANVLVLKNDGNIGIGTVSPLNKLDVAGSTAIGSGYAGTAAPANGMIVQGWFGMGTTTPATLLEIAGTRQHENYGQLMVTGNSDHAFLQIRTTDPTNKEAGIQLGPITQPTWVIKVPASSSDLRFNTSLSGGGWADRVTIKNSGYLGIGVNNPTNLIETQGSLQYNYGEVSISGTIVTGYLGTAFTQAMVGSVLVFNNGWTTHITQCNSSSQLTVADSNNLEEQVYGIYYPGFDVTSGGAVGIGTISPGAQLDVKTSSLSVVPLNVNTPSGTQTANIAQFQLNGSTQVVINSAGSLGVGMASPGSKLQVYGNAAIGYSTSQVSPANGLLVYGPTSIGVATTSPGTHTSLLVNGGTAIGYSAAQDTPTNGLAVSGSMGIGLASPASPGAQLEVTPTVTAYSDYKGVKSGLVYNGGAAMTNCYLNYIAAPSLTSTGTITNRYALVTEANAGSVGIGTTSPATELQLTETKTISGTVTDGYSAGLTLHPAYSASSGQTVTRHNYIDVNDPGLTLVTITNAAVMRFDKAAGTHKAVDAGTTKGTPGDVKAWIKVNINGVIYYIPAYISKTA